MSEPKDRQQLQDEIQAAEWEIDGLEEDISYAERELERMKWDLHDAVIRRDNAIKALKALS